jgi:hypothetical protein
MPYVVLKDTSVPRVIASGTDAEGREYVEEESATYGTGTVLGDEDVSPSVRERLDDGDEHLGSLLKHVSDSEAEKLRAEQAQSQPRIPEHEAEAEVLAQDGQDVLTRDEVTELNLNGDPEAAEEVEDDASEGREAEDPDAVRIKEVDDRRRGDADAPKAKSAAKESGSKKRSRSQKAESSDSGDESA